MDSSTLQQQFLSTLRAALIAGGGYLVGKGYISDGLVQAILPLLLLIGPLVWSWVEKQLLAKQLIVKQAEALNAGINLSNQTPEPTPLVPPQDAPSVIKAYKP